MRKRAHEPPPAPLPLPGLPRGGSPGLARAAGPALVSRLPGQAAVQPRLWAQRYKVAAAGKGAARRLRRRGVTIFVEQLAALTDAREEAFGERPRELLLVLHGA